MKNIRKLKDGVYEVRFSYIDSLTGQRKRPRRRIEGDEIDALIALKELQSLAEEGDLQEAEVKNQPLSEWIDDYIVYRRDRQKVACATLYNEEKILRKQILESCGEWLPCAVKTRHLDKLIFMWSQETSSQSKELVSPITVRNRFAVLKRLLRWVLKQMDLPTAFLREVDPIKGCSSQVGRVLSPSEAKLMLEGMKSLFPHWHGLFATLLLTGQRWGSVTALKWDDVDFDVGLLTFSESHYQGVVKAKNKTKKLVRMPMSSMLMEVLEGHLRFCQNEDFNGFGDTSLVFYPRKKTSDPYLNSGQVRGAIRKVCEVQRLEKFTCHDLRRTFNSWLVEAGVEGTVLRSLTGHSRESMTDHYYRGSMNAKALATEVIASAIGPKLDHSENLNEDHYV